MEDTYKAVFYYDGNEPKGLDKKLIEYTFASVYNVYCNAVNPHYEEWNNAHKEGDYMTYIREKTQPYIDEINNTWKSEPSIHYLIPIEEFFLGEECNLSAKLKDGTIMTFFLRKE